MTEDRLQMCDCGHSFSEHVAENRSMGDNIIIGYLCTRCSCMDPMPAPDPDAIAVTFTREEAEAYAHGFRGKLPRDEAEREREREWRVNRATANAKLRAALNGGE